MLATIIRKEKNKPFIEFHFSKMVSTDVLEGIAQYSKSEIYFKCKVCFEGFSDEHILELHISSCHPFEDSTESGPKIEVQDASTTASTPKNIAQPIISHPLRQISCGNEIVKRCRRNSFHQVS